MQQDRIQVWALCVVDSRGVQLKLICLLVVVLLHSQPKVIRSRSGWYGGCGATATRILNTFSLYLIGKALEQQPKPSQ